MEAIKQRFWWWMSLVVLLVGFPNASYTQSKGFLYGTVTLKNGETFKGQLRWDNQEAMWDDIFDAYKADRPYHNLLSSAESRKLQTEGGDFKFGFMELWEDRNPDMSFMFRCSFGDMVRLEALPDDQVELTLRNGHRISLKKDGGDVDEDIIVVDQSLGRQKFDFSDIRSIQFQSNPGNFQSSLGEPVYGKVMTSNGIYEGFVTWDREECLGNDIISGKHRGQMLDIKFQDISEIKAEKDGSLVTLRSGKQLFLNDHDDVDGGNHGIVIRGLSFGSLELDWDNFISVTLIKPQRPPKSYKDYSKPSLLSATVRTQSGRKFTSQIVFDLDEIYDIEFLNGANGGFSYFIPFHMVKSIEPQNDKFSAVSVRSGQQFMLGDSGDVDIKNNGLILKFSENSAQFLEWSQVKSIHFD